MGMPLILPWTSRPPPPRRIRARARGARFRRAGRGRPRRAPGPARARRGALAVAGDAAPLAGLLGALVDLDGRPLALARVARVPPRVRGAGPAAPGARRSVAEARTGARPARGGRRRAPRAAARLADGSGTAHAARVRLRAAPVVARRVAGFVRAAVARAPFPRERSGPARRRRRARLGGGRSPRDAAGRAGRPRAAAPRPVVAGRDGFRRGTGGGAGRHRRARDGGAARDGARTAGRRPGRGERRTLARSPRCP